MKLMIVTICLAAGLISCANQNQLSRLREFYDKPVTEQLRTFRNRSMADQLDLYLFGNQIHHPPATYLANCFALNGKAAVQLLRARLSNPVDDLTVRDIVALLSVIDAMHEYDIRADKELLEQVAQSVKMMRDLNWQKIAKNDLDRIRNHGSAFSGNGSECGS